MSDLATVNDGNIIILFIIFIPFHFYSINNRLLMTLLRPFTTLTTTKTVISPSRIFVTCCRTTGTTCLSPRSMSSWQKPTPLVPAL